MGGFILLKPLRKLTIRSCFPKDLPFTALHCAAMVVTYTFKVEGDSLRSNFSYRKESTMLTIFGGPFNEKNTTHRTNPPSEHSTA